MKKLSTYLKESLLEESQDFELNDLQNIRSWIAENSYDFSQINNIEMTNNGVYIDGNLTVEINGNGLPFKIYKINGDLSVSGDITGLNGFPEYVAGWFSLDSNSLKNLKNFPNYIGGQCNITAASSLETLQGMENSEIKGDFRLTNTHKLKSLKYISQNINNSISLENCWGLENINDIQKNINSFLNIQNCPKLINIPDIYIKNINNESGILIKNCKSLKNIGDINADGANVFLEISGCPNLTNINKLPQICSDFIINNVGLTNLNGFPKIIKKSAKISCKKLESVDGLPQEIGNILNMKGCIKLTQEEIKKIPQLAKYKKLII